MRVLARVLVGCGVTAAAVPSVLVGSALAADGSTPSAQTVRPSVLQSNWFWHQATADQLSGTPAQGAVPEPSGVPAGDLALAISDPSAGTVSKEPYLAFDLSAAASGASIGDFTFTLPLDASATQLNAETIPLKACLPTRLWTNSQDGGTDWSQKPADDCTTAVKGRYDATKQAYTFTVPTYAQGWLGDVNTGVAILPDGYTSPFQLVFAAAKAVTATMTYTPAASAVPATGDAPLSASAPASPAPAPASVTLPAPAAPVSLPASATGSAPVLAVPAPMLAAPAQPQAFVPAANGASATPTPGFWLAGGVLGLLLVTISLVLGDAEWAFTAGVRTSRLDQLLRARRSARSTVTSSLTHAPEPQAQPA